MANAFDVNRAENGKYGAFDVAGENGFTGRLLAGMLPMLIMTFVFSGVQAVAPESIAGEKERGTIATLLITPVRRSAIALGKVIALSVIAILSGVSSFVGTIFSLPKMMGDDGSMGIASYGIGDYAVLFFVILSTVIMLTAAISIVSVCANTVKEATTSMAPLMVVTMMVSLLPMLGMDVGGRAAYFIPVFNSVKSMSRIFGFQPDVPMAGLSIVVNVAAAGILTAVLTKMFGSEKVMFSK